MTRKKKIKLSEAEILGDNGNHTSPEITAKQKAASIEVARNLGLDDQQIEKLLGVKIRTRRISGNGQSRPVKKSTP